MTIPTRLARITGPVAYQQRGGERMNIPLGPCLIEQGTGQLIDIIWGAEGQNSVALSAAELESAEHRGDLTLLDLI